MSTNTITTKPRRPSGSVKKLSTHLEISSRHCRDLLDAGMPLDPTEASRWRAEKIGTGDSTSSAERLREERILLVKEQRRREDLENQRRRSELMPRTEHESELIGSAVAVKTALWRGISELPPRLAGLNEPGIARILEEHFRESLQRLYDGDPVFWDGPKGRRIIEVIEAEFPPCL